MLVRRNGIYKNIKPNDYGIFLKKGFIKVENNEIIKEKLPKTDVKHAAAIEEEPVESSKVLDLELGECQDCTNLEVTPDVSVIEEEPKINTKGARKKKQQQDESV